MRNTSPFKYLMQNISPSNIPPPNVNVADQIPLQIKIRNTRLRSDLLEKFQRKSFFSGFLQINIRNTRLRSDLLGKFQR